MSRIRDQDACPSALQVHQAADGALVRVRLPGGQITAPQLAALAGLATEYGSGTLELTSRGSVQLRGLRTSATAAVAEEIAAAGLLPSASHERARNIVASPLSGRSGGFGERRSSASQRPDGSDTCGFGDVRPLVNELDDAIQRTPALAALPGRFWFGLDDGRGDVASLATDIGARFSDEVAELQICGRDTGVRVSPTDVISALVDAAVRFVDVRENAWRSVELVDPAILIDGAVLGPPPGPTPQHPIGWIPQVDGRITLGAGVPLGIMPARTAEFLAAIEAPMSITPWRSVLIFDLDEGVADAALQVLPSQGLIFDENSPWLRVSACTGTPGCEKARADVRGDAAAAVESGTLREGRVHYVGCDRACGSPVSGVVLVADDDGYRPR